MPPSERSTDMGQQLLRTPNSFVDFPLNCGIVRDQEGSFFEWSLVLEGHGDQGPTLRRFDRADSRALGGFDCCRLA